MKIRIFSIACVTTAAALLVACTAVSRNTGTCEQLMRSKLAENSSDTLRVANRAAAIRGSRVVVEGSIEHVVNASEVPAALVASAPGGASGTRAVAAAAGVGAASAVIPASAVSVAASGAEASSPKPVQPKTVTVRAAAECTFHGEELDVFRWLAPARLVAPVGDAASS